MSTDPPDIGHNSRQAGVDGIPVEEPHVPKPQDLFAMLGALSRHYISKPEPTQHDMLFVAHQSLTAVVQFGIAHGADGEEIAVLQKLMVDLQEISAGRRVKHLEVAGTAGRPPGVREDVAVLRAGYAAGMEILIRGGRSLKEAGLEVARRIPRGSIALAGVTAQHWKAVRRWRDDCTGSAPPSPMKDLFDQLLAREGTQPGTIAAFLRNPHTSFLRDPT